MPRKMGSSSSQPAQMQSAPHDAPLTSQPPTTLPADDGSQDDGPQPVERSASTMDASVEDTVRKAKRARTKASPRGRKKSMPQHVRGYAIQPSQDMPSTQLEGNDEDCQVPKKPRGTKRSRRDDPAVEPAVEEGDVAEGALDDVDINTLNDHAAPAKSKERRRGDIELQKLQRDAQDSTPFLESTPKPRLPAKRSRREGARGNFAALVEEAETSERQGTERVVSTYQPPKRGKGGNTYSQPEAQEKHTFASADGDSKHHRLQAAHVEQPLHDEERPASVSGDRDDLPAESISTPPESPDLPERTTYENDDNEGDGRHPIERDSPRDIHEHAVEGHGDASHGVASQRKRAKPKESKPRKRTDELTAEAQKGTATRGKAHVSAGNDAGNERFANEDHGYTDVTTAEPKRDKRRKKVSNDVEETQRGQVRGTWSKTERARADEIFADVVRVTAIPAYELKVNIIDWKNPTPALQQLKNELYEAFPQRDFKSIARFCQRRYNSFDRGKWTEEQDNRLREAFELWPDQWTAISDHVDRFWEDCRGRWRDVLSRPAARAEAGPWSRDEEVQLTKIVQECRKTVMQETEDDAIRDDPGLADAMISWKVVAEKMGNTRAAKRCREKWARLKQQGLSAVAHLTPSQPITSKEPSFREREANVAFQACEDGDVYDMLQEICDAVPDLDKVFDRETTFWSVVAIRNPQSKYTSSLRRKALAVAIEQYSCQAVRAARTLAAKADAAKGRMQALETTGEIELVRSYEAKSKEMKAKTPKAKKATKSKPSGDQDAIDDGADATGPRRESKAKRSRDNSKGAKKYKSADMVVESDAEDQDASTDEDEDDVQSAQIPAKLEETSDDDDDDDDAGEGDRKARQPTDELSRDPEKPGLSPSTFLERCKGGQGKGEKGKAEKKKRKEDMKG